VDIKSYYSVSEKTGPLQLIWHDIINLQHSLTMFGTARPLIHWLSDQRFLNWLRTSCLVSITTVATWRMWTEYFCIGRLRTMYRWHGNKWVAKRLWSCVSAERKHSNTYCNIWRSKTFYYPDRNTVSLKDLSFLFIRQQKLWNDMQLRIAMVTRFSWYFAVNTTVF